MSNFTLNYPNFEFNITDGLGHIVDIKPTLLQLTDGAYTTTIATSSVSTTNVSISGILADSTGYKGNANQILSTTGNSILWVDASAPSTPSLAQVLTDGGNQANTSIDMQNNKIVNVADATEAKDAVNLDVLNTAVGTGISNLLSSSNNWTNTNSFGTRLIANGGIEMNDQGLHFINDNGSTNVTRVNHNYIEALQGENAEAFYYSGAGTFQQAGTVRYSAGIIGDSTNKWGQVYFDYYNPMNNRDLTQYFGFNGDGVPAMGSYYTDDNSVVPITSNSPLSLVGSDATAVQISCSGSALSIDTPLNTTTKTAQQKFLPVVVGGDTYYIQLFQ